MLSISLCTDIRRTIAACKSFGKIYGVEFYLYEAVGGEEILGAILFEVKSELVETVGYRGPGDDPGIFDGLLRAGLNYAQKHGIETGCVPESFRRENRALFAVLNYPAEVSFSIVNFFGKYKNCRV